MRFEQNEEDLSLNEADFDGVDISKLTSKKKQYLKEAIGDKNGAYSYLTDPSSYKKARKRL